MKDKRELRQSGTGFNRVFLSFASFYPHCIQGFSKTIRPLISMLKTPTIISTEDLLALVNMTQNTEFGCKIMEVIIKKLKNHFSRIQANL